MPASRFVIIIDSAADPDGAAICRAIAAIDIAKARKEVWRRLAERLVCCPVRSGRLSAGVYEGLASSPEGQEGK